ncbi:DCC1-like thiol-disulfide oxidoreductase family protein [Roseibacterium beibuensis]|uniref:thiol-disulfide oxidoreductase DCC family protein n=1 Tax=[Roseibacterium] beibuensis TaxID=1193142 RepID=UPI00217F2157|nr:DCC1-like thiol-disulfide oxidoreductase family protein [Roseibacterium beibuensis]MCS6627229.1 DCC1-like thiol-disulfide oxidoreductase family protein [Roseibacterium beibuensis]
MSRWSPQPAPDEQDGLILFDGVCVFCSRWVRFVIRRDRERRFRFLPIQSERGRALAARFGIDPDAPETNAVVWGGRIFFKSDAALVVLEQLPETAPLAILRRLPRGLRNPAYDLIARNRYRIFGRTDQCMVPSVEDRARFVS